MADIIEFESERNCRVTLLRCYLARALAGEFTSALVIVSDGTVPEFRMCLGDEDAPQLAVIGALDVAKARVVRLPEAEVDASAIKS